MIRWPRASSTAPAIPAAPDASTTTGGDTRNRTSASTTRCAAGRNVRSQSHSCTARSFRERPSALDKRSLVDRLAGADQLGRGVDLAPRVPEQYTARPALPVDVRDDAFAVRLVPPLDRRRARIDFADRLVAEVEQVGIEERDVVVGPARAPPVRSHSLALRSRMISVLDPEGPAECGAREAPNGARGE